MGWAKLASVRWRMETIHPGGGATHARLRQQASMARQPSVDCEVGARNHGADWFRLSLAQVSPDPLNFPGSPVPL
jgi:hypothetical protein